MTQRNPLNERYTTDKQLGKTRKSAASAKPTTARAANVHEPAPKTKKQKRAEARERERKLAEKRGFNPKAAGRGVYDVPTDEYKMWRRRWWICLGVGIAFAIPSFVIYQINLPVQVMYIFLGCSWVGLILALWIDLGKLRKIRKNYNAGVVLGKSKEARAQQKARAAEVREQRKEAEEAAKRAAEEGDANPEPEKKGLAGIASRFSFKKDAALRGTASSDSAEAAESKDAEGAK